LQAIAGDDAKSQLLHAELACVDLQPRFLQPDGDRLPQCAIGADEHIVGHTQVFACRAVPVEHEFILIVGLVLVLAPATLHEQSLLNPRTHQRVRADKNATAALL
jgi:hypothetical protein